MIRHHTKTYREICFRTMGLQNSQSILDANKRTYLQVSIRGSSFEIHLSQLNTGKINRIKEEILLPFFQFLFCPFSLKFSLIELDIFSTSWATRPCPPSRTLINIRGLEVKIPTKITAIISRSWLDVDFYIFSIVSNDTNTNAEGK